MTDKAFSINENGRSIRCRLYAGAAVPQKVVIYGHGFAGHKENKAALRFAAKYISKHSDAAVIVFDWPGHGEDALKNISLADCDLYLKTLIEYVSLHYDAKLYGYATSFGGYLFLKYMKEHGSPFAFTAFRNPAINMHEVMRRVVLSPDDESLLAKGKPVMVGFDRKIRITKDFLDELKAADITGNDFTGFADSVLVIQGMKDEVVCPKESEGFAEKNNMLFFPVEKADHRFSDPSMMDESINIIISFFDMCN